MDIPGQRHQALRGLQHTESSDVSACSLDLCGCLGSLRVRVADLCNSEAKCWAYCTVACRYGQFGVDADSLGWLCAVIAAQSGNGRRICFFNLVVCAQMMLNIGSSRNVVGGDIFSYCFFLYKVPSHSRNRKAAASGVMSRCGSASIS